MRPIVETKIRASEKDGSRPVTELGEDIKGDGDAPGAGRNPSA